MSKIFVFIIIVALVIGGFYYYKPTETKDTLGKGVDVVGSLVKDKVSDFIDSRMVNLGQPTVPCVDDSNCNEMISDCLDKCSCVEGDCIINVQFNSSE